MLLKELQPAVESPVPVSELSTHLRLAHGFVDDGSENGLLELYLRNATAVIEKRTSQALITRTFSLQVGAWDRNGHLHLPVGPVAGIDGIQFVMPGSTITLEEEDWELEPGSARQRLTGPGGGPLWPLPHGGVAELTFSAGYGATWVEVPDDLRQAVLLLAAHYYENRFGDVAADAGLPFGIMAIVEQNRPVRL